MTKQEQTARRMIAAQSTEYLLKTWEDTTTDNDPYIPTVRGWLMDELKARFPKAFDLWIDSDDPTDESLREYIQTYAA